MSEDDAWLIKYWRPAMAWQYLIVCLFDFVIAPVANIAAEVISHESTTHQWVPITLQNGGFYHMAMATIIGVYAFSRGQEKIAAMKIAQESSTTPPTNINIKQ